MRLVPPLLVVLAASSGGRPALAFTVGSPLTRGCHERITAEALRRVRQRTGLPAPIAPTADEQALIDDLPYHLDPDVSDLAGAALTLAVRDPDLFGNDPANEVALARIAGDPANQRQHCLRTHEQREPDGSVRALADCADSIRATFAEALDGLDERGLPDPDHRVELRVYLAFHGERTPARLPLFHVRMGQALHTVEDAYSHTFRDQSGTVVAVLNWVDYVEGALDEAVGGPPHSTRLDGCDETGDIREGMRERATEAAAEVLTAALGPGDRAARRAALEAVLARHLAFRTGCSVGNRWCDVPESALRDPGCGCALGARAGRGGEAARTGWLALAVLPLLARRRLSSLRASLAGARWEVVAPPLLLGLLVGLALLGGLASSGDAAAEPATPAVVDGGTPRPGDGAIDPAAIPPGGLYTDGGALVLPPPLAREVVETRGRKLPGSRFGVAFGAGASIDRPAAALFAGARFRFSPRWLFGVDAEWNPFFTVDKNEIRAGALNLYLTAVLRFPLRFERVNLRITGHAGVSVGLLDVYGAPRGSVGPFAALSPLGIDVDLARGLRFVLDPVELVLPMPHVTGLPFYYPQYRLSAGFQFGG